MGELGEKEGENTTVTGRVVQDWKNIFAKPLDKEITNWYSTSIEVNSPLGREIKVMARFNQQAGRTSENWKDRQTRREEKMDRLITALRGQGLQISRGQNIPISAGGMADGLSVPTAFLEGKTMHIKAVKALARERGIVV